MIATTRIKVERNIQTGKSVTNSPTLSPVTIIPNWGADIQPNTSNIVFVQAGQTVIADKICYCARCGIREKDIITDLQTGEVFRVMNVNPWGLTRHLQIAMKAGVT